MWGVGEAGKGKRGGEGAWEMVGFGGRRGGGKFFGFGGCFLDEPVL